MDTRRHGNRVDMSLMRHLSRRSALRSIGRGTLGAVASLAGPPRGISSTAAVAASLSSVPRRADARPNIILLLLDDLRADDLAHMPAVQALLVEEGTSFTNFITSSPLCAPARASILRGQYPHNHGVFGGNEVGSFDLFYTLGHERSTAATWLHDAGYRTALIGKYLNEYTGRLPDGVTTAYIPPGWDEWVGLTEDGYYRFTVNDNGASIVAHTGRKEVARTKKRTRGLSPTENLYSTDFFASRAASFIARTGQSDQPFFLYLAPYAPHGPAEPAVRHAGRFAGTVAPRTPAFNEVDVTDKPSVVQAIPPLSPGQITALDERHAMRLESLQAVDELVAVLIEELGAAGALEQTYIVLSSDNGYHLGEHRIETEKSSPYEEAIRVPLLVRGPGVPAGQNVAAVASQVDLAPTFAAWGDAPVPDFVDGRTLVPLLASGLPPTPWRQTVLVEHAPREQVSPGVERTRDLRRFQALRSEEGLYVEYTTGERELYDLEQDAYQLANLAGSADPALLQGLSARLTALARCVGASCRTTEDAPL